MEIFLNNNLVGIASKSFNSFILKNIEENDKTLIDTSKINEISTKSNKFIIIPIADDLNDKVKKINEGDFIFNWDIYESIPLKYSIIKRNNKIFLHSIEIS